MGREYAHTCWADHVEIGHDDSGDDERCPLCQALDGLADEHRKSADLRQRLQEVENQRDAILLEARCWAGEAKGQRHVVNEVGSALGGVPDWGPIAKKVREKLADLAKMQEENAFMREALEGEGIDLSTMAREIAEERAALTETDAKETP